ncbi:MAG: HAD family hydrolase [Candidatus Methylomirabilales bacterium]
MPRAYAVLFDLDGVIADTAPFHQESWLAFARKYGIPMTEADFRRTFGMRNEEILVTLFQRDLGPLELYRYALEKEELFRRKIRGRVKALPGAKALIQALHRQGSRLAVVSSTPPENLELILGELQLLPYFQVTLSGRDVGQGKPHPEGYLRAAERLQVEPRLCVVIEDAPLGVEAAKRAGMRSIAVTGTHPREELKTADLIVDSLEQVSPLEIEALLQQ